MSRRRASCMSSSRVGSSPRLTALACLPSAVLVLLGRFLSVCFCRAPLWAFLTLRFAAARCLELAMTHGYPRCGVDAHRERAEAAPGGERVGGGPRPRPSGATTSGARP